MVAPFRIAKLAQRIPTVWSLLSCTSSRSLLERLTLPLEDSSASSGDAAVRRSIFVVDRAPTVTLADATRVMTEKGQGFLPVVDGGLVVGIVSLPDIRKWAREGGDAEKDEVQRVLTLEVRGYESQSPPT